MKGFHVAIHQRQPGCGDEYANTPAATNLMQDLKGILDGIQGIVAETLRMLEQMLRTLYALIKEITPDPILEQILERLQTAQNPHRSVES